MKVKVSYTINLEEIPTKIKEIVKKNEESLNKLRELSQGMYSGDHGANTLKSLSEMKQCASELSESYADCESILSGFLSAMFGGVQAGGATNDGDA
jgi:hypothetical protein